MEVVQVILSAVYFAQVKQSSILLLLAHYQHKFKRMHLLKLLNWREIKYCCLLAQIQCFYNMDLILLFHYILLLLISK
ncbi:hypothetical protein X975_02510, partial [Stegodyphus mimosarum]